MSWDPVAVGAPRESGHRGKGGKQGRAATGRKAIPPGVAAAVQAAALDGQGQADIARDWGVSRWYVKRLTETVAATDPDQITTLKRRLPSRLTLLAAGATERAVEAVEKADATGATKWTFAAKLATEANRWAQPAADNPGATLLAFIDALHQAGGGSLTVGPTPPALPMGETTESREAEADAGEIPGPAALHGDV